jgi:hypothetical protein
MGVDELLQEFGATGELVQAVLQFAARTTEAPAPDSLPSSTYPQVNPGAVFTTCRF